MNSDAAPTGPDRTTVTLAGAALTITLDDARAMKAALVRALDESSAEHRDHLVRMTVQAPVWIDPDGLVHIGAWLLERRQDALALTFRMPSGGTVRLGYVARVERAEDAWTVAGRERVDHEIAELAEQIADFVARTPHYVERRSVVAVGQLIEFRQGQSTILVEVETDAGGGDRLSARGAVEQARKTFEEAAAGIRPIAETILRQVTELGPESVEVEFGVTFNATAGVILASSAVKGNCKVTLSWKPKAEG